MHGVIDHFIDKKRADNTKVNTNLTIQVVYIFWNMKRSKLEWAHGLNLRLGIQTEVQVIFN